MGVGRADVSVGSGENNLLQLATIGLGLAAVYCGVKCAVMTVEMYREIVRIDGAWFGSEQKKGEAAAVALLKGCGYLFGSGLCLFGAYKAYSAVDARESMGIVPTSIGLVAAGVAVYDTVDSQRLKR